MDKYFDVYGIGNPLIDILKHTDDTFLSKLGIEKGIMQLIDLDRRTTLLKHAIDPVFTPGGSCANTIITLADLGLRTVYGGGIGEDTYGDEFEKGLTNLGVVSALRRKTLPTGSSIIFISKQDAERSMNTYLGACQEFDVNDVDIEKIAASKYLYFTGYMWDTEPQKDALTYAMSVAREHHTRIIFDLADPFAVNRYKDDFTNLLATQVDFCFANLDEAKFMTGTDKKEEAIQRMTELAKSGAIKDGNNGSVVFSGNQQFNIKPFRVNAIDTTGAGDIYAAGMLYGLAKDLSLPKSGEIASYIASKVVEKIGPRLDVSIREDVERMF